VSDAERPLDPEGMPEAVDQPLEGEVEPEAAATQGAVGGTVAREETSSADGAAAGSTTPGGGSAGVVASGILMSRLAGLVREGVFSRYFGTSVSADAFRTALRMPNVLQNLLGEGVLSASFIPVYSELIEGGRKEEAGRVAGAIFALLFAAAGGLALIGIVAAPVLVRIFTPGFEGLRYDLTVSLTRIIFPMTGILVLSAWALGVLNSHRKFFIPYVAPVLWNTAMITTMLVFGARMDTPSLAMALAWGALIGGVLQFAIQLPWLFRLERSLKVRWDTKLEGVRTAVGNAGPAILGRGVVQLSGWLDLILASFLAAGAVAAISYAQTIYVLPVSLFGMSVAAAELPELARQRGQATEVLRQRINRGLGQIAFFVVPSFVAYVTVGEVLVGALYQRGEFSSADTLLVSLVLAGFSLGLIASTGTRLFSSAFFALHDTRTPAKLAGLRVLLAAVLAVALMVQFEAIEVPARSLFGLEFGGWTIGPYGFGIADGPITIAGKRLGAVGLAVGAGVAAWVEWALLRRALAPRIGAIGAGSGALVRMFAGALVGAGLSRALLAWVLPDLPPLVDAAIVVPVFAGAYFLTTHLLGVEYAGAALRRFTRRFLPGR